MIGLAQDIYAFFLEHGRCGDLDAGVDGPVVWIACPCGASMTRRADEDVRHRYICPSGGIVRVLHDYGLHWPRFP
jgi:hypothetical protein